ncbi:MAG: glycosyltransferase family 2 protein [Pseudomonadota bacterium]|nr:glycosyltransferase family 2 protein [Pseudomonadota bacterium]
MGEPLVSIIIPCYNSNSTLPRALASVHTQTYKNWECIVIDDGSIHKASEIMGAFSDSRFRYIELPKNSGRGFVRQRGLEEAKGKYLCMVDSDDWILPSKIEFQINHLERRSDLSLVACSMAIVGSNDELVGLRHFTKSRSLDIRAPLKGVWRLPIPHAPSMIRMEVAKRFSFDSTLRIVEDFDYLLKILLKHPFGISRDVGYCYTEFATLNWWKLVKSNLMTILILRKYYSTYPVSALIHTLQCVGKSIIHTLLFITGLNRLLIRYRTAI